METKETIIEILEEIRPDVDFENDKIHFQMFKFPFNELNEYD